MAALSIVHTDAPRKVLCPSAAARFVLHLLCCFLFPFGLNTLGPKATQITNVCPTGAKLVADTQAEVRCVFSYAKYRDVYAVQQLIEFC